MAGKISFSKRELKEIGIVHMSQKVNQQIPEGIKDYITSFQQLFKFDRPLAITVTKTAEKGTRWNKEQFTAQDGTNSAVMTGKNQSHNNNNMSQTNSNNSHNAGVGGGREKKLTRQEQLALFEKELEEHRRKNDKSINSEAPVVYRYHDEGDELMKELEEEEKKKNGKRINVRDLFSGTKANSIENITTKSTEVVHFNELEPSNSTPSVFHIGNENQPTQNAVKPKVEDWLSDIFDKSMNTGGANVDTFFDLALKEPVEGSSFSTKTKSSRFSALLGISPASSPDGKAASFRSTAHVEDDDDITLSISSIDNIFSSSNLSANTKVDLKSLFANASSDTTCANYRNNQFINDSVVNIIRSEDVLSKLGFSGASPPREQTVASTDLESPAANSNVGETPTSNSSNQNTSPFAFHGVNNDSVNSLNKKKVRAAPVMSAASRMQLNKMKATKK
jgi:hypothetical protein